MIGEGCDVGPRTYVGSYTSIGNAVTLRNCEIENSIVMDGAYADCGKRIVDSMIGAKSRILATGIDIPRGLKLVLGDSSYVSL